MLSYKGKEAFPPVKDELSAVRSNGHKPNPTRPKKFPIGDRLTARKTDAPPASAGYEVLYHPFNSFHTVPGVAELGYDEVVLRASKITHI